jgi:hypothetical protein
VIPADWPHSMPSPCGFVAFGECDRTRVSVVTGALFGQSKTTWVCQTKRENRQIGTRIKFNEAILNPQIDVTQVWLLLRFETSLAYSGY